MYRRVLALFVALVAFQPSLGWVAQAAGHENSGHCTDELCFCQAARGRQARKAATERCHETATPRTMMTGNCHHADDTAPPSAVPADSLGTPPALTPAAITPQPVPTLRGHGLAGHLESHSPPPRPILS